MACILLFLFEKSIHTVVPTTIDKKQMESTSISPFKKNFISCGSLFPSLRYSQSDDDDTESRGGIELNYEEIPSIRNLRSSSSYSNQTFESTNNNRLDLRTGFSGHSALNSIKNKKQTSRQGEIKMMSEHRGIGVIKSMRKPSSPRYILNKKSF